MTKQEFDRIVKESVDGGNTKADAEAYVISGFKLPVDAKGSPVFESGESRESGVKKKK